MDTQFRNETVVGRRLALLLFIVGAVFAADTFWDLSLAALFWPLLVTSLSIGFIGISLHGARRQGWLLALGVYVLCFSVLALVCNLAGWGLLSRLWPLFIGFIGASSIALHALHRRRRLYAVLGVLLVLMSTAVVFVLAAGSSHWWAVFAAAGLSILISEKIR